jgi:hypothetical protein
VITTIASGVSLAISAAFVLVAAVLLVARLRNRHHIRHHYGEAELQDLSRDDIDPLWRERDRASLDGPPPPSWDPYVTRSPHRPGNPPQPRTKGAADDR